MSRWRRLAARSRPLFFAPRGRVGGSSTEISTSLLSVRTAVTARSYATAPAVTPHAFAQYLDAVGICDTTLSKLYDRQSGEGPPRWIAPSLHSYPVAVALSGGADSMALMLLLHEFLRAHNVETPLLAITVDHSLRPESGDEARYVGDMATSVWGVRHVIMECDWQHKDGAPRKSKLQEQAREYRYQLLTQACVDHSVKCLFVAHNLGDQLETVLFRLGRASGINGLAGMAARSDLVDDGSIALVRPLLNVSKASLKATCERFQQSWVEDPSNESLVFDRIRIRKALERTEQSDTGAQDMDDLKVFQRMAAAAKEEFAARENALIQAHTLHVEPGCVVVSSAILSDPQAFDELVIRVLSRLVRDIGGKDAPPRLSSVEGLLRDLRSLGSGKKVTLSGCCITKTRRGTELHFRPERPDAARTISSAGLTNADA